MSAQQISKEEFQTLRASKILWLLTTVRIIFADHRIKWWLDYGTLLGAVRDGKIIPWDADCDISCMEVDRERITALKPEFEACGTKFHSGSFNNTGYQIIHPDLMEYKEKTRNVHLDAFTWYLDGKMLRRRFYVGMDSPVGTDTRKGRDFPASWVENLSEVTIEDIKFPAPEKPAEFCKFRYGNQWLIPMTVGEFNTKVSRREDWKE